MADFLPPEILRYLILRTQPKTPVNFDLGQEFIVKLFNDLDRLHKRIDDDPNSTQLLAPSCMAWANCASPPPARTRYGWRTILPPIWCCLTRKRPE